LRSHINREQADVWVLTEAHDSFSPDHAFSRSSAPGRDGDSHETPGRPYEAVGTIKDQADRKTGDQVLTLIPDSGAPVA
jgi:hypothetical protein